MHSDLGFEMVNRMVKDLEEICIVEKPASSEGRQIIVILGPKKTPN